MSLDFCCDIQMVGSEFGTKYMKAWIYPEYFYPKYMKAWIYPEYFYPKYMKALSQRFRLLLLV